MTIEKGDSVRVNTPTEMHHGVVGKVLTEPSATGRMIVDVGTDQWHYYADELEKVEEEDK